MGKHSMTIQELAAAFTPVTLKREEFLRELRKCKPPMPCEAFEDSSKALLKHKLERLVEENRRLRSVRMDLHKEIERRRALLRKQPSHMPTHLL